MRIRIGASLSGAPISVARLIYIREGGWGWGWDGGGSFESASPIRPRCYFSPGNPVFSPSQVHTTYLRSTAFGYHGKEESRFVSPGIGGTVIGRSRNRHDCRINLPLRSRDGDNDPHRETDSVDRANLAVELWSRRRRSLLVHNL